MRPVHSESYQVGSLAWRCLPEKLSGSEWGRPRRRKRSLLTYPALTTKSGSFWLCCNALKRLVFFDQVEKLASSFCTECQRSR